MATPNCKTTCWECNYAARYFQKVSNFEQPPRKPWPNLFRRHKGDQRLTVVFPSVAQSGLDNLPVTPSTRCATSLESSGTFLTSLSFSSSLSISYEFDFASDFGTRPQEVLRRSGSRKRH